MWSVDKWEHWDLLFSLCDTRRPSPTALVWTKRSDWNVTLVFPFSCRQVDYEGLCNHMIRRRLGGGGQFTNYITSLLFLMAQHRTILKIIPIIWNHRHILWLPEEYRSQLIKKLKLFSPWLLQYQSLCIQWYTAFHRRSLLLQSGSPNIKQK